MAEVKNPKEYLIRAKFYRTFSLIFVVLGIIIFSFLYVANVDGRLIAALKNPFTLGIFIIPFLPAAVLSFLAARNEKRYYKLVEKK